MSILIATDVFGMTPAVASLIRALDHNCVVVSPFDDAELYFQSEQTAYHAFLAQGGVAQYAEKLKHLFKVRGADFKMAIGFSAGASALWLASANESAAHLQSTVLFYGSRVRDHKQIQPLCPVRLIFAEHEAAFDATVLTSELRELGHQAELVRHTSHGFMNPYSRGFDVKVQAIFLDQLAAIVQELGVTKPCDELVGV